MDTERHFTKDVKGVLAQVGKAGFSELKLWIFIG
jgi:hypothetical protein